MKNNVNLIVVIDNCEAHPCKNGICENMIGGFKCTCIQGFTGMICETR